MFRLGFFLALVLSGAAVDAQPARPFGDGPAWPVGSISDVLVSQTQPGVSPTPATPSPSAGATTRVRAPYRQAEQPAATDLDTVRRAQRERLRDPTGWRRDALPSEQARQTEPTSRFRETPVGPQRVNPQ